VTFALLVLAGICIKSSAGFGEVANVVVRNTTVRSKYGKALASSARSATRFHRYKRALSFSHAHLPLLLSAGLRSLRHMLGLVSWCIRSSAIKFGSNTDEDCHDLVFSNITIWDSNRGLGIQQRYGCSRCNLKLKDPALYPLCPVTPHPPFPRSPNHHPVSRLPPPCHHFQSPSPPISGPWLSCLVVTSHV
jgi:hypothetical protein